MSIQGAGRKGMVVALLGVIFGPVLSTETYAQAETRGCGTSPGDYVEAGKTSEWTITTNKKSTYDLKFNEDESVTIRNSGASVKAVRRMPANVLIVAVPASPGSQKNSAYIVFTKPRCADDPGLYEDHDPYRVVESDVTVDQINGATGEKESWAAETGTAVRTN